MTRTTHSRELLVKKTITTNGAVAKFEYEISSPMENVDHVEIIEHLPTPIHDEEIIITENEPKNYTVDESSQKISFSIQRPPPEPIKIGFKINSKTLDPNNCVSKIKKTTKGVQTTSSRSDGHTDVEIAMTLTPSDSNVIGTDGGTDKFHGVEIRDTVGGSTANQSDLKTSRTHPAVGIAPADSSGSLARTLYQATQYNLAVFVGVTERDSPLAQISERLGATVVLLSNSDIKTQKSSLLEAVRAASYPGLIFTETCSEPIDLKASIDAFESSDADVVTAVRESDQTNVMVGIPAYNEAETVSSVVESARKHADEVVVVDDGSSDQTALLARDAGGTVIEHDRNQGYGGSLQTIFEEADHRNVDRLVVLDGDGQHDTGDIPHLLAEHEATDAEIVIGNRFGGANVSEIPLYRRLGLWVINGLVNVSIGNIRSTTQIEDVQSGFRSYDATAVESIAQHTHLIEDQMSASTDILYLANREGFTIREVPTTIRYDVSNANTHHPVRHGFSIVRRIVSTLEWERPVTVLGVPGILLALMGIGVGYWAVSEFVTRGTAAAGSTLLSLTLLFVGSLSVLASVIQYSVKESLTRLDLE